MRAGITARYNRIGLVLPRAWCRLYAAALGLLNPQQAYIIQPPYTRPFYVAQNTARPILHNPLKYQQGSYSIDFADLEHKATQAKLLMLCSPHNPVGRVWQPDELRELLTIAKRHNLYVFSDEIHQDLIIPGAAIRCCLIL